MKNPSSVHGYEIERDKAHKLIKVTNKSKIAEVAALFPQAIKHKRNVPTPTTEYLVQDQDFDQLSATDSAFLYKRTRHNPLHAARGRGVHMDTRSAPRYPLCCPIFKLVHTKAASASFEYGILCSRILIYIQRNTYR